MLVFMLIDVISFCNTAALAPTELEKTECLEQLRVLENGYKIKVLESDFQGIGVDTPEDLAAVNELLSK